MKFLSNSVPVPQENVQSSLHPAISLSTFFVSDNGRYLLCNLVLNSSNVSQRQRDHAKEYMRGLAVWREKNLSDRVCQDCAAAPAEAKFRPGPEEQAAVDAWLDEKYPVRKKEEEKLLYPFFDMLSAG